MFAREMLKVTFLLSYFCMTKSTKSQQGGLAPSSFRTTGGVHELVARTMRGKCVRYGAERKSVVLPLSTVSAIPRVRTYHAREPSRFVHASLHARIIGLAGVGGVSVLMGWRAYFLFLMFAVLRLYLVGVGAVDDPHGRGEHCSPAVIY